MDDKLNFVDIKTFKEMANDDAIDIANVAIRKFMTISKMDELQREDDKLQLKFSITTADVDRDNDTVMVEGWDFTDFKNNPVVLWAHNYSTPPVAKAINIFRDTMSIDSTAEFTPKDVYEFGYMIYQMYKGGFLNAVSVGFQPTDFELARDRDGGINFTRQSLMEYSAVPVPSNPNALLQARSKGINTLPMKKWAEDILDDWDSTGEGLLIPKNMIETVRTDSDPKQKKSISVPDSIEQEKDSQNTDKTPKDDPTDKNQGEESKGDQEEKTAAKPLEWGEIVAGMKSLLGHEHDGSKNEDKQKLFDALTPEYKRFEKTMPEFRFVEAQILRHMADDYFLNDENGQVEKLTDEIKTEKEIKQFLEFLVGTSKEAKTDHVKNAMLEAINAFKDFKEIDCDCPEHKGETDDENSDTKDQDAADVILELDVETDGDQESVNLDDGLDAKAIAEIVERKVKEGLRIITGKLD